MANLTTYNKKRDFSQTSEPKAEKATGDKQGYRFVVQRHHASRLHYDFRLEIDGALKSWAVPKGPSLNPKDRRLAVQVEDHPLSYGTFEGTIPKGSYGAGTVSIFDAGTYMPMEVTNDKEFLNSWKKGSIKFSLKGKVLKGEFALVRMQGDTDENWLLIKHKDKYATDKAFDAEDLVRKQIKEAGKTYKEAAKEKKSTKKSKQPTAMLVPKPMLAKLSTVVPDAEDWLYERKIDGFRAIARIANKEANLLSRNGLKLEKKFPSLIEELRKMEQACLLDGEIVIEDKEGKSYFQLLQSGEPIPKNLILRYYVFDILSLDGHDLQAFPLTERKELLHMLLKRYKLANILELETLSKDKDSILNYAKEQHWEGIVAKRKDSAYQADKRTGSWLKIKLNNAQEAIICGFTKPQNSRSYFGALVLGLWKDDKLSYIGNCGTGFTEQSLAELYQQFKPLIQAKKPFPAADKLPKEADVTWLKPELVCEVYYYEWTADKKLRHPVYKGLRSDKTADEIEPEYLAPVEMEKEREVKFGKKTVQLTNLTKIYWPQEEIRKGELLAYYEEIGPYLLPYLKDKPISMHRFPNGIEGQSFFQKDVEPEKLPSWLKTTEVYSESTEKTIDYLLCNDLASLLYIVNLGSIEINPWLSTYKSPEKPDFAVLDLDPNGANWKDVIAVAHTAKQLLDKAKAPAYLKTSGSTGLHIQMYVAAKYDYDIVRDFVQFLAELIHQQHPETTSLVRDPKKRKGLIYLDYLQNKRGQTIVAPYSVRPKPMATVSAPLAWEELNDELSIQDFTIFNMLDRVAQQEDPWSAIWKSKVDIKKALAQF